MVCHIGRPSRSGRERELDRAREHKPVDEVVEIRHHGETVTVQPDQTVELAIPPIVPRPAPRQPPGRAPAKRRPSPGAQRFDPASQG